MIGNILMGIYGKGESNMALTEQEIISAQEWNKLVKGTVETAMGAKLDGDFIAANYPAGFNYAVKQQYYNGDSLSTLDSLVTTTDGIPTLSSSFSNLYKRVIDNMEYGFSSSDLNLMSQEETKQAALVGTICNAYNESGLDEPPVPYPSVMYIMKRVKEVTGTDYLNVDLKEYPNLAQLCRCLSEYARLGVNTTKMENAWSKADDRLNAISNNVSYPGDGNGGIMTSASSYNIGWDKLPETDQLLMQLKSGSNISLSVELDNIDESSSNLHFESGVTAKVPFNWFFHMTVNHEHEYDLSKYAKSESKLSVNVSYSGVTTLAAVPKQLSADNKLGWFDGSILKEAADKSGKDLTGYKLHGSEFDPGRTFGKNGELQRLKTFVISQQPAIKLKFSNFNCEQMQEVFSQKTDISFSIFGGLIKGKHNNDYSFSNYHYDSQLQTIEVEIIPAPIGESGAIGKQTAFVLGGVAESYGN